MSIQKALSWPALTGVSWNVPRAPFSETTPSHRLGPSGTALAGLSVVFSAPFDDGDVSWLLACWWLGGSLAVAWRWLVVPMGSAPHGTNTVALPCRQGNAKPGVPGLAGTGGGWMAGWLESLTVPNVDSARVACPREQPVLAGEELAPWRLCLNLP